jgi:uncharacterized membrane protein
MNTVRLVLVTLLACVWCAMLLAARRLVSGESTLMFLAWNLFLAGIPLGLSVMLERVRHPLLGLPVLGGWLLFFPNAPYVLTDLLHLRARAHVPLWYDLLMLLSFALVSLWMGFQSLRMVQDWVARKTSAPMAWLFVLTSLVLSGFGIYLGRFLRWNSWDIVSQPHQLLRDIAVRVIDPFAYSRTWLVTAGFAGLLIVAYVFWVAVQMPEKQAAARVRE